VQELKIALTINQAPLLPSDMIYDVVCDGEIITTQRDVAHAAYIADLRGYEVVRRDGRPVKMTEEQQLRSRLRKIIASGQITLKQMSEIVGGDEYGVVDRIAELRSRTHKILHDFQLDRVDLHVRRHTIGEWPWVTGDAA